MKDNENCKSLSNFVYVFENFPNFNQLKSLMTIEERNMGGPRIGKDSQESTQDF